MMVVPALFFRLLDGGTIEARNKPDGEEIHIVIDTDKGAVGIVSTPEGMMNLSAKMSQLAAHALALKSQLSGHQVVHVSEIAAASAQAPTGAGIVAIAFRGTTGSLQHFGLTPDASEGLRAEMEAAEKQARDNLRQTLQ